MSDTTVPEWPHKASAFVMFPDVHSACRAASVLRDQTAVDAVEIEEDVALPRRGSRLTAWVNASFGCNEACTYCVVPRTRGAEQSRKPGDIRREMLSLG